MKDGRYYLDIISEINFIVEKYNNVSVTGLCNSILGMNIPIITLGEGSKKIVYVGGQAGNDKLTPYILLRYIKDICSLYQENGSAFGFSAEYILKNYTITVIPILNPDGLNYCDIGVLENNPLYERVIKLNNGSSDFSNWNGNARGIDLRNNYFTENTETNIDQEPEVGALCNFLKFGDLPEMIFAFDKIDKKDSVIYFGDGEAATKRAIALTQMTGVKRIFYDDSEYDNSLISWSNQELGIKTFLIEISAHNDIAPKQRKEDYFGKYLNFRKMLFCAPMLSKIK